MGCPIFYVKKNIKKVKLYGIIRYTLLVDNKKERGGKKWRKIFIINILEMLLVSL
jgi:hypothetical protein